MFVIFAAAGCEKADSDNEFTLSSDNAQFDGNSLVLSADPTTKPLRIEVTSVKR